MVLIWQSHHLVYVYGGLALLDLAANVGNRYFGWNYVYEKLYRKTVKS